MESYPAGMHEKISLIGESVWVTQQLNEQNVGMEMCQCGTEKIISKSADPFRMRASLLSLVFANQLVYTHYRDLHDELLRQFNLPSLKHHVAHSHASPNWFIHKKDFNHQSLILFQNNFQGCMRSLTMWARDMLGRYVPELHSLINSESMDEFGKLSNRYFVDRSGTKAVNIKIDDFYPEYLKTRFRLPTADKIFGSELFKTVDEVAALPESFAIISAYATTGETWSEQENSDADQSLYEDLKLLGHEPLRINAYSPDTVHMEPSWCVQLSWDPACDIGLKYKQDAIYYVKDDTLYISFCDDKRLLVPVGQISEHMD